MDDITTLMDNPNLVSCLKSDKKVFELLKITIKVSWLQIYYLLITDKSHLVLITLILQ